MMFNRNPTSMTVPECRAETINILAHGLLRSVKKGRRSNLASPEAVSDSGDQELELAEHAGLTVVNQPRG